MQQTILRLESLCEEAIKDRSNLNELFQSARPRLLRIINLRSPPQLNQRVDSEDVLQETFVRATQRFNEFANERRVPVFVWLRGLALERLVEFKRQHLGAAKRDLGREVSMRQWLNETSLEMTRRWAMNAKSPSQIVSDRQRSEDLKRALEWLPENYREVLVLRFFESLSVAETAVALDCSIANAKVLQFRALKKLNQILRDKIGWDSADRQEDSQ
ncbi:MAG: sigma-70 family RNA polymerase sigma factor [Planctomycetota bacterium]